MVYEGFWQFVSYFGDVQYWIGLTVASLIIYPLLSRKDKHKLSWIVLAMLPAVLISHQVVSVLKAFFEVARPCLGLIDCPASYSFPSGHAAVIFAFAIVTTLMAKNKIISALVIVLAFLVSLSRVFLNYHTFPDIGFGAVVGLAIGFLFYLAYKPIHVFLEKKKIVP